MANKTNKLNERGLTKEQNKAYIRAIGRYTYVLMENAKVNGEEFKPPNAYQIISFMQSEIDMLTGYEDE